MSEHARLSASGANKWLNCPNSVNLEELIPNKESTYALEGTVAHALGELKIKQVLKMISKREYSEQVEGLAVDDEMDKYTDEYRDYVLERYNYHSKFGYVEVHIEQKLDFSSWVPGGFGTGDVVLVSEGGVEIIDLKYGKGVQVYAENNPQLRLYAMGAVYLLGDLFDINHITVTVFQPRLNHISSETLSFKELMDFGEYVKKRAELTEMPNAQCVAGKHCDKGFCRARPRCRAYSKANLRLTEFKNKHPNMLSDDEIEDIVHQSEILVRWSNIVKDYALDIALKGKKFKSLKLVEGRSIRKYIDNKNLVIEKLKLAGLKEEEFIKKDIKSITEIEKLVGKNALDSGLKDIWVRPPGKATLVDLTDKRSELGSYDSVKLNFEEILKESKGV